jgi:hypothetical protein
MIEIVGVIFLIAVLGFLILNPLKSLTLFAKFAIWFLVGVLALGFMFWLVLG